MFAVKLPESQTKPFMQKLLTESVFDGFDLRSAMVSSFARMELAGAPDKAQNDETAEKPAFNTWEVMRPYVTHYVRNGGKPKAMKLVFSMPPAALESRFPDASALFLNVLFDGQVSIVTGTSQKSFSMDKSLEHNWDAYVQGFLQNNQITFETE